MCRQNYFFFQNFVNFFATLRSAFFNHPFSNNFLIIQIVSTIDTTKYLEENYGDCGVLGDFKSEVLSLVEQEIAYRGDYLLNL